MIFARSCPFFPLTTPNTSPPYQKLYSRTENFSDHKQRRTLLFRPVNHIWDTYDCVLHLNAGSQVHYPSSLKSDSLSNLLYSIFQERPALPQTRNSALQCHFSGMHPMSMPDTAFSMMYKGTSINCMCTYIVSKYKVRGKLPNL
ncbi:hypothetical protein PILCRDRAFT_307537 [Piloderma croceum F 1598]|uniref:Uncharacterized protein n=1 Tax=Piloderma croceum (strain F 1598) TaxID=765440 RepID=A0A0C3C9Y5_PILCF|nr:hypothetical protein PILCRDRAFT_307537 [Piloderma croceum F 1598]